MVQVTLVEGCLHEFVVRLRVSLASSSQNPSRQKLFSLQGPMVATIPQLRVSGVFATLDPSCIEPVYRLRDLQLLKRADILKAAPPPDANKSGPLP